MTDHLCQESLVSRMQIRMQIRMQNFPFKTSRCEWWQQWQNNSNNTNNLNQTNIGIEQLQLFGMCMCHVDLIHTIMWRWNSRSCRNSFIVEPLPPFYSSLVWMSSRISTEWTCHSIILPRYHWNGVQEGNETTSLHDSHERYILHFYQVVEPIYCWVH